MRLIYSKGQRVGDPVGHYVYLWRHGEIDRLVGMGTERQRRRWKAHIKAKANDNNQRKMRYFRRFWRFMDCYIIAEGLATAAVAADLETEEISQRGIRDDGGPLLNVRTGNGPRGPRRTYDPAAPRKTGSHHTAWKAQPNFALDATWKLMSVPWRRNSAGRAFYTKVLAKLPGSGTIAEVLALGKAANFTPGQCQGHLRWLYTWGGIEIAGRVYAEK